MDRLVRFFANVAANGGWKADTDSIWTVDFPNGETATMERYTHHEEQETGYVAEKVFYLVQHWDADHTVIAEWNMEDLDPLA